MILLDEKQTSHVSKALDIYLQGLENSARKTTQDTEAILQRFKEWYKFTIELSNKIVGKQGKERPFPLRDFTWSYQISDTLVLEEKAKRENVRKKEAESDGAEANAKKAQRKLELQQEKLNEAIQRRQMMMDVATTAGTRRSGLRSSCPVLILPSFSRMGWRSVDGQSVCRLGHPRRSRSPCCIRRSGGVQSSASTGARDATS
jgi:hypothetical protein